MTFTLVDRDVISPSSSSCSWRKVCRYFF
jgi:hypothetical protein